MPQVQAKASRCRLGRGRCLLSPRARSPAALAMRLGSIIRSGGEGLQSYGEHIMNTRLRMKIPVQARFKSLETLAPLSPLALVRLGVQGFYSELIAVTESSVPGLGPA